MLDDGVQAVGVGEDLRAPVEVERDPDVGDVVREAVDVAHEGLVHVVIDRRDRRQVERRNVAEAQTEPVLDRDVNEVLRQAGERVDVLDDVVLAVGEHALQAAQHRERQDVVAVVLLVDDVAEVLVRRVPDDARRRLPRCSRLLSHARPLLIVGATCIRNVTSRSPDPLEVRANKQREIRQSIDGIGCCLPGFTRTGGTPARGAQSITARASRGART